MPKKSHLNLPYLQITLGSVMVSFSAVFVRLTTTTPTIDAFYRMFFGGVGLLLIALLRRENLVPSLEALFFISLSSLFFSLDLIFWHHSIDSIGPGLATLLVNFQVFFLAFIGIFFYKDQVNWKFILYS